MPSRRRHAAAGARSAGAPARARDAGQADVTRPVLHACTRPMPADRGDFGSGVVDLLGPDDIFVALVDYGTEVADQGLFEKPGHAPAGARRSSGPTGCSDRCPG